MVRVTPKTDEQFEQEEAERKAQWLPWPVGATYDYEVLHAKDSKSKSGNEMIVVDVRVFNAEGKQKDLTDYIGEWNEYKLKRLNPERYEAGLVEADDLVGKTGKCKLNLQKGQSKGTYDAEGKEEFYADKNGIAEYLKADGALPKKPALSNDIPLDLNDEVGF